MRREKILNLSQKENEYSVFHYDHNNKIKNYSNTLRARMRFFYFDSRNIMSRKLIALLASNRLHSELSGNGNQLYSLSFS